MSSLNFKVSYTVIYNIFCVFQANETRQND